MRPVISATLAMLAYACALSAAEWAPEYEPQNGTGPAMLADAGRICVALAVWGEARGEGYDGQAAVATVIVNRLRAARADGQDVDLCDVVLAPGQFLAVEAMPLPRMPWVRDPNGWNAALQVTDDVLSGSYQITPPACAAATSFHRAGPREAGCVIGAHVFTAKE